jgi:hypothetical protein
MAEIYPEENPTFFSVRQWFEDAALEQVAEHGWLVESRDASVCTKSDAGCLLHRLVEQDHFFRDWFV